LKNWDDTDTYSYALVSNATVNYYDEIEPFFIEIEEIRSAMGFLGIDRISRLKRQLEGVTQKAMERELFSGDIRIARGHENKALVGGATVLNFGVALSPRRALALLEHSIGDVSHGGEQGIIHATRDVVALLSSNSQMLFHNKEFDHLQTMGGTPVIAGSGYSGDGPRIEVASAQITGATTLTIVTSGPHGLTSSDLVRYSLVGGASVGTKSSTSVTATVTNSTTFTVPITTATPGSSETATGTVQYIAASGTVPRRWIYATGNVKVYLGDVDVVNDNLGQAYDVTGKVNDIRLKAIRPAAVYFGPSIHLAVQVDLTA
jgi:hypothetical protein